MEIIHALKSDGSVIKDIKFFQEAYTLSISSWIYSPTKIPIIYNIIEFIYRSWEKFSIENNF